MRRTSRSTPLLNPRVLFVVVLALVAIAGGLFVLYPRLRSLLAPPPKLLTDPFLQLPTENSVRVVWFTEFAGSRHLVQYGTDFENTAIATTTKLSKAREDARSRVGDQTEDGQIYPQPTNRDIWRHEAEVVDLASNVRTDYRVVSRREDGAGVASDRFTLAPLPQAGVPQKILLTSDHQAKPMTSANLQKVVETVGQVDAVFFAGDLINVPDRASEWFDDNRGNAFFPSLQGRASYDLERAGAVTRYTGGAIAQYAPLFPAIGNHEVMGRFSVDTPLNEQFNDPYPEQAARQQYARIASRVNPLEDAEIRQAWLKDNTFNTDTYEEVFALPPGSPGGEKYYAVTFGDVRLIVLFATNIWRRPGLEPTIRGRYRERDEDLDNPAAWGYGQHIFEPIAPGSQQYAWLQTELARPEFRQAKYKVVMFHHPPHSLGDNIVPAYTDPVQKIDYSAEGRVRSVRYEYPLAADYLIRDVVPLLESAGVQLVLYGHSHLWNRFVSPSGTHFLETSNVGNTYGAYTLENGKRRPVPSNFDETYTAVGDPNGLDPVIPNLSPLPNDVGRPQPYIASNDITVFSILDTGTGAVSSFRFDARKPTSQVVKFDEFQLGQ